MSWAAECRCSMNGTRDPAGMVTWLAETPVEVMVIVAAIGPIVGALARSVAPPPPPPQAANANASRRQLPHVHKDSCAHQKNFLEMLKPRYQSSLDVPPRAN